MNEEGLELSLPLGVSGAFFHDRGRYTTVRNLLKEFNRLSRLVVETEQKLDSINDPEWLNVFGRWRKPVGLAELEITLNLEADGLEKRLVDFAAKRNDLRQEILKLEPHAFDVRRSLVGCHPYFRFADDELNLLAEPNPEVKARNAVIDCFLAETNLGICGELDEAFPKPSDRPARQFPDTWFLKFDVTTFVEAYNDKRCRPLVHSMISKRRRKRAFPRCNAGC
jgi:hypothetical protein